MSVRVFLLSLFCLVFTNTSSLFAEGQEIAGPSSSQTPFVKKRSPEVSHVSIFTVGDELDTKPDGVDKYKTVGIPDGMGAYDNHDGTFTLLLNHELSPANGVAEARAHRNKGAFVSKYVIEKGTFKVISARDLLRDDKSIHLWDHSAKAYLPGGTTILNRHCSANLPVVEALYNDATAKGTPNRIFMNGEETSAGGRAFAYVVTGVDAGKSWELPRLGKVSFENAVACPFKQDLTIVACLDDSAAIGGNPPSELYFYIGTKTTSGLDVEKAGLTNGRLFGLRAFNTSGPIASENRTTGLGVSKNIPVRFELVDLGERDSSDDATGAKLQADSIANTVTQFSRVEDGEWDPVKPNTFYFVTTDIENQVIQGTGTNAGRTKLWRVIFDDIANPTAGGTIAMLLNGTESIQMLDNIAIDRFGRILMQEDVGNSTRNGKTWLYEIENASLRLINESDKDRFGTVVPEEGSSAPVLVPATFPFTTNEEQSGIIDAGHILGSGWFIINVQAAYQASYVYDNKDEIVSGGQVLAMHVPLSVSVDAPEQNVAAGSSQSPYLLPVAPGVETVAIFTVGDSVNLKTAPASEAGKPYRMVGIPDGLGAFNNEDGKTFTLLMNHEVRPTLGTFRAHGNLGAFVSRWTIDRKTLKVMHIEDHNPNPTSIMLWNPNTKTYSAGTTAYNRFCSADLPEVSAFFDRNSGLGTTDRIFMNGEESSSPAGRAFAHIVTGDEKGRSYELPRLGKMAWENSVACPAPQPLTIVACLDDADRIRETASSPAPINPSELYFYVGTKTDTGTVVDKAGLTN